MLKAVLFDFDGTIADTLPICIGAFAKTIAPVIEHEPSLEEVYSYFGPTEEGIFQKHFPDRAEELTQIYLRHYKEMHTEETQLVPNLMETIRALIKKGVRVALVTAKGGQSCKISLDYYKIANDFETIEVGSPLGRDKGAAILRALATLNIKPEDTAYVGDSPKDVISSRKAGVYAWGAAWLPSARPDKILENKPDAIFYTIDEFRTRLEQEFGPLEY